jgi:uncharacterized protein
LREPLAVAGSKSVAKRSGFLRGGLAALVGLCALLGVLPGAAPAPAPDPLYTGRAIVTGTDERDRPRGLAECLDQVLVKVSGDPNITNKPGIATLRHQAEAMVSWIGYHDRMSGLPKHDEQGSRDRPFTLTAQFDPEKIRSALATLGETPWQGRRPSVELVVGVRGFTGTFDITTQETRAALMRESIDDAADRYALDVVLPGEPVPAGAMVIHGSLVWSDAAFGWVASWKTTWNGRSTNWGEHGISFDEAFRGALAGATGVASGHGPPTGAPLP